MAVKRVSFSFAIISVLLSTLACSLTADALPQQPPQQETPNIFDPIIPVTGGACGNDLQPVQQGATWTYTSTGSPSGDFTYTDTISEVRDNGYTLTSQITGLTRTQEWECLPEGLRTLQLGGGGASASISTQEMTTQFETVEISGVNLPKSITPGLQWQYSLTMQGVTAMPGDQQAESTSMAAFIMQEIGAETITVPAGTFEAVKFQSTSTIQVTADFQGTQVPIIINGSSIVWFAPGVGYIKSIENSDFGGTPYTATTELQSYSIP
ncbi:MAG: hypothetical protein Q8L87_10405 [Anaerolineales bacterium]|nr:hypothetical protein [Anaerolineales bacterium]